MIRLQRILFISALVLLSASTTSAQVTTGTPPFGSFSGGPDTVNNESLNIHLDIPVIHKAGRGVNFDYDLTYDSSVYYPVIHGSSKSWQNVTNWGWSSQSAFGTGLSGYITYFYSSTYCYDSQGHPDGNTTIYTNFEYIDSWATIHYFPGEIIQESGGCGSLYQDPFPITAADDSGLIMENLNGPITTKGGASISPPVNPTGGNFSSTITDRNGNQMSVNSSGVFTDTLGKSMLTVSGAPPNSTTFTYPVPNGSAKYTMSYRTYTVRTNFGCSGISEYGPKSVSLVDRVTLPDGSYYQFNYEATPGYSGDVTGRLLSFTLSTGGKITYAYTGGSNGITCSDGSTAGLHRTTPDSGSNYWNYVRTAGSGAAYTTVVTDPLGNDTELQFQGIYPTEQQNYRGSHTSGTLLQTMLTCYNGNTSNCNSTSVSLPITQRNVTTELSGSSSLTSEKDFYFDGYGNLYQENDYDYGPGTVGPLLRITNIVYASLNGIVGFPQSVTVTNGSGSSVSKTVYAYDGSSVTTLSGTPQHTSPPAERGNLTSIQEYTQNSAYLTQTFTYYDTGNVQTATDINGAQTTYNYPDATSTCGNAFPVSLNEPPNLSRSMAWNCFGGVETSLTDENSKVTSLSYTTDPNFWRPESTTDPTGATTTFTYSPTTTESILSFNSGNSSVDKLTTMDGLGRVHLQQTRQAPGSTNFDTVETDYSTLGQASKTSLPFTAGAGQTNSSAPGTSTSYDALGRVSQVSDSGGGSLTYTYTQNDAYVSLAPAPPGENSKRRQLEYDGLGRLTSVCEITGASDAGTCGQNNSETGYWTKYGYDALGDLVSVTQNAQATSASQQSRSYSYDFMGRLTSESEPESGTANFTYDTDSTCGISSAGDLIKRVDAVGTTRCAAYDALHRVTSLTYSGGYASSTPNKYFVYDSATVNGTGMSNAKTRLAEAYTCVSSCTPKTVDEGFSYSARGEVTDVYESTPNSGSYYHVTQSYWANGQPYQLSNLSGLPTFTYGVDGEGRTYSTSASSGQNPVTSTNYNVFSQPTTVNFGSSDSDTFSYDANSARMTAYQFNINTSPDVGTLTWNANGSLQKLVGSDPFYSSDDQTCTYKQDDLARIASTSCGSAGSQSYSYDAFGNLSKTGSGNFGSFLPIYKNVSGYTSNRYVSIPGITVSYDSDGNVLYDGLHTYAWDADGNSVTVDSVGLTYDALDRMVEQNRSGSYTQIVYSPTGAKLGLMSGQTLQKSFIALPAGAIAVYTSSGLDHYRHPDWLGSARLSSSTSRSATGFLSYAPFGETEAQGGTADPSFTGQNQDTVPNLYDFPAREYDPLAGRWPSPDPGGLAAAYAANPQSWNRYAYVVNDPLGLIDPLGMDCAYLSDDGTSVESVDQNSSQAECGANGGYWVDGTITQVQINSDGSVNLMGTTDGTDVTSAGYTSGTSPGDSGADNGINGLLPLMEAQEQLELFVTNRILIPGLMITGGAVLIQAAGEAQVGACVEGVGVGCFVVAPFTGSTAAAGGAFIFEGIYYGIYQKIYVPKWLRH